jgi:starch synthase
MELLFASAEIAPMAKVGGLADVVSALSKAMRLLGHKVTIAMPRYASLEGSGLLLARRLSPLVLPATSGGERVEITLFDGRLGSGVDLVLFDVPGLYEGAIYRDTDEDARRFGLFARAVTELMKQRAAAGTPFDVVHLHDWPAAPVAYLMKQEPETFERTKSVLTIHNLAHQGMFDRNVGLAGLGLDGSHFVPERLEFYGKVNFLKAGLVAADAVTTVSDTYARDIVTPEHGERLDGVLRARKTPLAGIVNGIDYAVYNPTIDPSIIAHYDAEDPANKGRCKSALLAELGLEVRPERPLIVSLGRIVAQKGSDLLASALPKILKSDVGVIIAGDGDATLKAKLEAAVAKAPERAAYKGLVTEPVAHRLLAAADFVLLPSRFEPCGLVQLYAQRYGALPIAHATGGLVDTIVDCDAQLETGTGFLFEKATATALVAATQRAIAATLSPRWPALRRRVMRLDLGWDRPARRYAQLYRSLTTALTSGS